MPHVIAVDVLKGGAGKTTISSNLARSLAVAGWEVELYDLDLEQKSLSAWANLTPEDYTPVTTPALNHLRKALERSSADVVVMDGPPRADAVAKRMFRLADLAILPIMPGLLDVAALKKTLDLLEEVQVDREDAGQEQLAVRAVINRGKSRTILTRRAIAALDAAGVQRFPLIIGDLEAFGQAMLQGLAVVDFQPEGKAAQDINALAAEVINALNIETDEEDDG